MLLLSLTKHQRLSLSKHYAYLVKRALPNTPLYINTITPGLTIALSYYNTSNLL
ncbi:hypothetical protein [Postechiella marina]|uniref:hypothetical protein n=1 Tax=Postechiella marina TaxID=943941 RepID=UPI0031D34B72